MLEVEVSEARYEIGACYIESCELSRYWYLYDMAELPDKVIEIWVMVLEKNYENIG